MDLVWGMSTECIEIPGDTIWLTRKRTAVKMIPPATDYTQPRDYWTLCDGHTRLSSSPSSRLYFSVSTTSLKKGCWKI